MLVHTTEDSGQSRLILDAQVALSFCLMHIHRRHCVVVLEPNLVLVQPRKTRPCLTERLLMGRKESNQIKIKLLGTKVGFIIGGSNMCLSARKHLRGF